MKYILSLLLFVCFVTPAVTAQSTDTTETREFRRNTVYVESYLIRHDFSRGLFSINYERGFGKNNGLRVRVGLYPEFSKSGFKPDQNYPIIFKTFSGQYRYVSTVCMPIALSHVIFPDENHQLEYGGGLVFRHEWYEHLDGEGNLKSGYTDIVAAIFPVMYRYQGNKGLTLRAGVNIFYSWPILPSPSFSAGYSF